MVDHYLLLDKLHSIGLTQNVLFWFSAYLHNRHQCVVIQGYLSDYFNVETVFTIVFHKVPPSFHFSFLFLLMTYLKSVQTVAPICMLMTQLFTFPTLTYQKSRILYSPNLT